jgi:hypothetical protein
MGRNQIAVWHFGERSTDMSTKRAEELSPQLHGVAFVAEQRLASVPGIGLAPEVARIDHPINEIRDCCGGYVYALPQLARGERLAGGLCDHDVQQSLEVSADQVVLSGEVASYPIGLRRHRAHIG